MDLFDTKSQLVGTPLAEKLRPDSLKKVAGQSHILDEGGVLKRMIARDSLSSLIFWGPPGCGKTTLAKILCRELSSEFVELNAVSSGVKDIKAVGEEARGRRKSLDIRTVVFVDEIHRFNKSQQDVLLPFVEQGDFSLIGATTENPSYYLNRALISRCRVLEFLPIPDSEMEELLKTALADLEVSADVVFAPESLPWLVSYADGDARKMINALESLDLPNQKSPLTVELLKEMLGAKILPHDRASDQHYDLISAFIKSVRGSDPDAALYYLARMLKGGEDPRFVARRLIILASEDIGNADPKGLGVATDGLRAVEFVGMPEGRIILAQVTTYLACAPKSNRSYKAIADAYALVDETGSVPVPKALRSASTSLMKKMGYGKGYQYSHDGDKGYIDQRFFPEEIPDSKTNLYDPVDHGYEKHMKQYLSWVRGKN